MENGPDSSKISKSTTAAQRGTPRLIVTQNRRAALLLSIETASVSDGWKSQNILMIVFKSVL